MTKCTERDLQQLRDEVAELDTQLGKLADTLSRTAVALRGPEPALTRWSWHDLPELAAAVRDALIPLANAHSPNERAQLTDEDCQCAQRALYGPNVELNGLGRQELK